MQPNLSGNKIILALAAVVLTNMIFSASPLRAVTQDSNFFNEFNKYVGKWKGRGIGQRNSASAREAVSCKGVHRWLKKGRLFEQSYTCWGADFIFSGSVHLKPAKNSVQYVGVSLNGAKEEIGKVVGRKLESGTLEFMLHKNFSKQSRTAKLNMLENGKIEYSITQTDKATGYPLEVLKIIYAKRLKK